MLEAGLSNACITPAVRLICCEGITQEIANVGRMKTASTRATAKKHRLRVLAARVLQLVDMHGVDLDAGVGEEAVDDQDDAGQPAPRRQEVLQRSSAPRMVALDR